MFGNNTNYKRVIRHLLIYYKIFIIFCQNQKLKSIVIFNLPLNSKFDKIQYTVLNSITSLLQVLHMHHKMGEGRVCFLDASPFILYSVYTNTILPYPLLISFIILYSHFLPSDGESYCVHGLNIWKECFLTLEGDVLILFSPTLPPALATAVAHGRGC